MIGRTVSRQNGLVEMLTVVSLEVFTTSSQPMAVMPIMIGLPPVTSLRLGETELSARGVSGLS